MADLSFLPDDFDEHSSLLHRIRRQASNLLRSPTKPPARRRPTTPARTPTEDKSFTPYLPLANRYERSIPRARTRRASISSTSSAELSFPPTPLNNVFPFPPTYTTDQRDDTYESDLHIIRHGLSLPFVGAKAQHDAADVIDLSQWDPSDVIPDSPTLPPSLALPLPVPVLVLAPTPAPSEARIASEPHPIGSRPHPTILIPPVPAYPPPPSRPTTPSDLESKWDGETMVGDTDTVTDFELEPSVDHQSNPPKPDPSLPDWTLHLTRPSTWSSRSKNGLSSSSRPSSPFYMDWTLELPASSRPPTPMPPAPIPSPATAKSGASPISATTPSPSPISQCPSSWLSLHPHPSSTPFLLRKPKSSPSLLPLPRSMASPHRHPPPPIH